LKRAFIKILRYSILTSLLFFLAFILFLILSWIKLQEPQTQAWLGQKIITLLPAPWQKNAQIGRIGGRLPGFFLVDDLTVQTPNGDQLTLKKIRLKWDWKALWLSKVVIHRMEIEQLSTILKETDDHLWLPDLITTNTESKTETASKNFSIPKLSIQLDTLQINSLRLELLSSQPDWKTCSIVIPDLKLRTDFTSSSNHLEAALNSTLTASAKIDEFPAITLNAQLNLKGQDHGLNLQFENIALYTQKSHLNFNSNLTLGSQWLPILMSPERILSESIFNLTLNSSSLDISELGPLLPEFLTTPELIHVDAIANLTHGRASANVELRCLNSEFLLYLASEHIHDQPLNHPLHAKLKTKLELSSWLKQTEGALMLNLDAFAIPNQIESYKFEQQLHSKKLSFQGIHLPDLSIKSDSEKSILTTRLNLNDPDFKLNVLAELNPGTNLNWTNLNYHQMSLTLKESCDIPSLTPLQQRLKVFYPHLANMNGQHTHSISLSGNQQNLQYDISTNTHNLSLNSPIADQVQLSCTGALDPLNLMLAAPNPPPALQNNPPLKESINDYVDYAQVWLDRFNWPDLQLVCSGNQLHSAIDELSLQITPKAEKGVQLGLNLKQQQQPLLQLDCTLSPEPLLWQLDINRFTLDAQKLIKLDSTWLAHAFNLNNNARLNYHLQKNQLTWSNFNFGPDSWFSTQGMIDFNHQCQASLNISPPNIEQLVALLKINLPFKAKGHLNLDYHVHGTWWRPESALELTSKDLTFQYQDLAPLELENINLSIHQNALEHSSLQAKLNLIPKSEAGFSVNAHLPLTYLDSSWLPKWQNTLVYEIKPYHDHTMSVNLIKPFCADIIENLEGSYKLNLNGTVDLNEPTTTNVKGDFHLIDLKGQLVQLKQSIDALDLELKFDSKTISLHKFKLRQGAGLITLSGHASSTDLNHWHDPFWDLNLILSNWTTKHLPQLALTSNANLNLSGNLQQHQVTGSIKVSDLLLKPEINFLAKESLSNRDPHIIEVEKLETWAEFDSEEQQPSSPFPSLLKTANINVKLKLEQNNWIRHDMLKGEVTGDLTISKLHDQESVYPKGHVSIQKSVLKFQGNRFNMDKGNLIWQGDLIPAVDMTYLTTVKPYQIKLILKADQVDSVTPEFSSYPWLDNSDIISVLLIGRPLHTVSSKNNSDNLGQDIAISQGVSQLSKQLGIEDIGIEVDSVTSKGGTIRVGRYLHPRLYIAAAKTMGEEENQEISIDFLILKNLKFKTSKATLAPIGFDMIWSIDY